VSPAFDETSVKPFSQRRFPLILLIGLAAMANFLVAASSNLVHPVISLPLLSGLVLAQVALLSAWAVLGPQRIGLQWFASLLTLAGLVSMIGLGVAIANTDSDFRSIMRLMLGVPLLFSMAQLPLWILRLVAGWRIVRIGAEETMTANGSRQFGILHLLGTTTAVALLLGLAQCSFVDASDHSTGALLAAWIGIVIYGLVFAVVNAIFAPLGIWIGLHVRDSDSSPVALVYVGGVVLLLAITIAHSLLGEGGA